MGKRASDFQHFINITGLRILNKLCSLFSVGWLLIRTRIKNLAMSRWGLMQP
jgi:hypothetical protein